MQIHNVRLGFATNSSSSHSIVFFPTNIPRDTMDDCDDFGWEFFTASSRESKEKYFAATLFENLRHNNLTDEQIAVIASEFLGFTPELEKPDYSNQPQLVGYVDHQSLVALPLDRFNMKSLDHRFVNYFKDELLKEGTVVLGGNDNTEHEHPAKKGAKPSPLAKLPIDSCQLVSRYDEAHDYFTLMNYTTGAKIRMSLTGEPREVLHASLPELVDMKITNYCQFNCSFCYQNSTPYGKHARMDDILQYLDTLESAGVFEVALGGGEPSQHPEFRRILEACRSRGIIPNWTTKDFGWLGIERIGQFAELLKLSGSVAFSCTWESDIHKLLAASTLLTSNSNWAMPKIAAQMIVGLGYEQDQLEKALEVAKGSIPVTLLGYKEVGRGANKKSFGNRRYTPDYGKLIKVILDNYCRVSVDTLLAEQMEQQLDEAAVSQLLRIGGEGKFSCYIDAVERTIAPSSYCPPTEIRDFDGRLDTLKTLFKEF
jgi:hypothetical protein